MNGAYAVGRYTPSEGSLLLYPKNDARPASARRAIVAIHGHGSNSAFGFPDWPGGAHMQYWVEQGGYWVFATDAGGTATWRNATGVAAVQAAIVWLQENGIAAGLRFGINAWSMGGGLGAQLIKELAALFSGAILWAPELNLERYHGGVNAAEIDAAYTAPNYATGTYSTNAAGHKTIDEYPTWRDKCPIRIYHGTADTVAEIQDSRDFVSGVNQSQVALTELAGRTHTDLFAAVTTAATLAFYDGLTWT